VLTHTLENFIGRYMDVHRLPGLSAAVVMDGQVVLAEGFGVRSVSDQRPVTAESLFHMASVSKPFSATALMQLSEKGFVDLDARLVEYLPYFRMDDPRLQAVTLRQMLAHISGMPDVDDYEWGNSYAEDDALERYARSLTEQKLIGDPGEQFAYSNTAFELLGAVIARVSGLTFEEYMRRNIFQPLGMKNSTFLRNDVSGDLSVTPHKYLFSSEALPYYPYNRAHAPSSTLHTNAEEVCQWMLANLKRGELNGVRILQDVGYEQLWKPYAQVGDGRQIGLSWFLGDFHGYSTIHHSGSDTGFCSMLFLIPQRGLGITVMSNLDGAPMKDLAAALAEICLGLTPPELRTPVFFPVIKIYAEKGFDAALDCIRSLRGQAAYQLSADRFVGAADQLFDQSSTQTLDVIRLGLEIDSQSAPLYAIMALEYARVGDAQKSASAFAQAEALDADDYVVSVVRRQISAFASRN
jgi:CubicO group peptidase (beta-lactamase class C family)